MKKIILFISLVVPAFTHAQHGGNDIPSIQSNISYDTSGKLTLAKNGRSYQDLEKKDSYGFTQMLGEPVGAETGILLNFKNADLNGTVAYGPLAEEAEFPTVAFLPKSVKIEGGKSLLELKNVFKGPNDFFKLAEKGKGIIGFRVLNNEGRIIYEGRVAFTGKGPYQVVPTLVEGPFINDLGSSGCVISYKTQVPVKTSISVGKNIFQDEQPTTHHEITLSHLEPAALYDYVISYGDRKDKFKFSTAPRKGSRDAFSFGFASANRAITGGGERDFGGTNYQASREIMAAALMSKSVFFQSMGDITNGGNTSDEGHLLEYSNWKRALEPFWSRIPVYVGMGDHEVNYITFTPSEETKKSTKVDRFPYATESGEASFANAFVHPQNGPQSEDGARYDTHAGINDFPTYKENVYHYTYGNLAMIVLNTEYWKCHDPEVDGVPEGYIMDQQLKWLQETIQKFETDPDVDHIVVNIHSAVFPNGDHVNGAMWYEGKNQFRARVGGVPLEQGILERRDEILDLCVNKSKKFLAFLSGDEHNFAFLEVTPDLPIYPEGYTGHRLKLTRSFFHINNGGGGSASYAMLPTPWMNQFKYFTEPPTLALMTIQGKHVTLQAFRADTFEEVCKDVKLR